GTQHFGDLAGHQVGVDVVGAAVLAIADGGNDRDELVVLQGLDHGRLDASNVAHVADVQPFAGFFVVGQQLFTGLDQAAVFAGKAYRLAAGFVDHHHDVLLHLPAQHPFDHFHGFGI